LSSLYFFFAISYIDKDYEIVDSVKFVDWMSKPDPLVKESNFEEIVRGMTITTGRMFTPSFNFYVSDIYEYLLFTLFLFVKYSRLALITLSINQFITNISRYYDI